MIHSDYVEVREEQKNLKDMTYPEFLAVQEKRALSGERQPCPKYFLEVRLKFFSHQAKAYSLKKDWYLFRKYLIKYNMIAKTLRRKHNVEIDLFQLNDIMKEKCRKRNN